MLQATPPGWDLPFQHGLYTIAKMHRLSSGTPPVREIEGPDQDGCVWICSAEGRDVWCQNLGPKDKTVEVLCQWLASIDANND